MCAILGKCPSLTVNGPTRNTFAHFQMRPGGHYRPRLKALVFTTSLENGAWVPVNSWLPGALRGHLCLVTDAEWGVGLGPLAEPLFLHWLEVHFTGHFIYDPSTAHPQMWTWGGLKLTICSLEVQSSNHVSSLYCFTRIKHLELPLVLEHRKLARIPNSAPPIEQWSLHYCTTSTRAFCNRWDCWGSHDNKWPRAWAQVSSDLALNPL